MRFKSIVNFQKLTYGDCVEHWEPFESKRRQFIQHIDRTGVKSVSIFCLVGFALGDAAPT